MKKWFLWFWLVSIACYANPIALWSGTKTWERCLVAVEEDSSRVSCAVGYHFQPQAGQVSMLLPVLFQKNAGASKLGFEELSKIFQLKLEMGSVVLKPVGSRSTTLRPEGMPDDLEVVAFSFALPQNIRGHHQMVFSYTQPHYEGALFYLPSFEGAISPKNLKEFTITFFPTSDAELKKVSEHQGRTVEMKSRITIHPHHMELIQINRMDAAKDL